MSQLRVSPTGIVAAANQATSSFDPTSITGLQLWLDASNAGSIHATGGLVDTWDDLSGNARNATSTLTLRPTTGTRTMNSLNALDFDGSNDTMTTASFGVNAPYSFAVVTRNDDGADGTTQFVVTDVTNSRGIHKRATNNRWAVSAGNERYNSGIGVDTTGRSLIGVVLNPGSGSVMRVGNDETNTGDSGTGALAGGIRINNGYDGMIAEVLLWNVGLNITQRDLVAAYLMSKWGV